MIATSLNKVSRYAGWADVYVERLTEGNYTALILAHCPEGYVFDEENAKRLQDKPIVVLDLREYGWNISHKNLNLAGWNYTKTDLYDSEEWKKLQYWLVYNNSKIIVNFTRELTKEMQEFSPRFPVVPLDLISRNRPSVAPVTKQEFLARPNHIMHWWGHSHEDRVLLHEMILNNFKNCWSNKIDHTARYPLQYVIDTQQSFRMSVALPGCGHKTFRHSESCVGSVPIISECGIQFAVPWNSSNSISLPTNDGRILLPDALRILQSFNDSPSLVWDKYAGAQENARQLDQNYYVEHHINEHIRKYL
jgi:hypothetical protein